METPPWTPSRLGTYRRLPNKEDLSDLEPAFRGLVVLCGREDLDVDVPAGVAESDDGVPVCEVEGLPSSSADRAPALSAYPFALTFGRLDRALNPGNHAGDGGRTRHDLLSD